jgi:NAD-dependent dihydropyrimidine dehydrogenase PreA subunit/biotin operon repressor
MAEIHPIYQELAGRIEMRDSAYVPLMLSMLTTVEQARVLKEMPARSSEEIAAKLGLDKTLVDKHIQEMYEKGLVFFRQKGGMRHFYAITELKDATPSNPKYDAALGEKFFDLWDAWFDSAEAKEIIKKLMAAENQTHPLMRIIPKWRSIKDVPGVLPCDDVRELLRQHEDTLAVNNCSCRRISRKRTSPSLPDELCLVTDAVSDYCVKRGSGHRISYLQALEIIDSLAGYGLIHASYNAKPLVRLLGNCGPYCVIFRWSPPHTILECAKSRFQAFVDPVKCLGATCPSAKQCVRQCLFAAPQFKTCTAVNRQCAVIEPDKCWGCGNCAVLCPTGAIRMKTVRPPEYIPDTYKGNF